MNGAPPPRQYVHWQPLVRVDWDFAAPDVDPSEVHECIAYELARSSVRIRNLVEQFRNYATRHHGRFEFQLAWLTQKKHGLEYLFWSYPEFPTAPYLAVPKAERDARVETTWSGPVPRRDWRRVSLAALMMPPYFARHSREFLNQVFSEMHRRDEGMVRHPWSEDGSHSIALFDIDWKLSSNRLREAFSAWLEENRPKDIPIKNEGGAGGNHRRALDDLKALGAARLVEACGSWSDAFTLSEDLTGSAIYSSHQPAWSRSLSRAASAMQTFVEFVEENVEEDVEGLKQKLET